VLPVGHEAEFKIKKDRLYLRVAGDKKELEYQVVAMQPPESKVENSAYRAPAPSPTPAPAPAAAVPMNNANGVGTANTTGVNNTVTTGDRPPQW
jgi:hypothetical protein